MHKTIYCSYTKAVNRQNFFWCDVSSACQDHASQPVRYVTEKEAICSARSPTRIFRYLGDGAARIGEDHPGWQLFG